MKVILHIGTEKTGTSAIQDYLYINREKLNSFGYHFIQSAGIKNNRAVVGYCMSDDHYDDFFELNGIDSEEKRESFKKDFLTKFDMEIKSIPSSVHTVIISSEHFHSRIITREEVQNVYSFLSTYFSEVEVVCYLREQSSMCASLYSTAIKVGHFPSFSQFVEMCNSNNIYYNYCKMLSNWENVFGIGSLNVSLFDSKEFLNGDLLDDFISKIDFNLIGKMSKEISDGNESLTQLGQTIGRVINKICSRETDLNVRSGLRRICMSDLYKYFRGQGEKPSLKDRERIYSDFFHGNEIVRKKFFPHKSCLFDPPLEDDSFKRDLDPGLESFLEKAFISFFNEGKNFGWSDSYANVFLDSALIVEKFNVGLAYELMSLARNIRPSGGLILSKLKEYEKELGFPQDPPVSG